VSTYIGGLDKIQFIFVRLRILILYDIYCMML
jgi:hypothetical protein